MRLIIVLLVAAVAGGAYAVGASSQTSGQTAKRKALAQAVNPVGARGRTLGLSRVTIPPGVQLAVHRHAGTQIAYIQKGTLTYYVQTGAVRVYRGAADENPVVVRRITAGHSAKIFTGDWLIEQPHVIHYGANDGSTPVVILLATLFVNGAPPSIPVG